MPDPVKEKEQLPGYDVEFIPVERRLNDRRTPEERELARGPGNRRASPGRRATDREQQKKPDASKPDTD